MLENLAQLSQISTERQLDAGALSRACSVVRAVLDAEDAYVVRSGEPHFVRIGYGSDPTAYEIKQKGYWLIWRELATRPQLAAGTFDIVERIVQPGHALVAGRPATHAACILPGEESNSELLIVRGPWPDGLSADQVQFLIAARPMLAQLVSNLLDNERRARQHAQLTALADVSKAFSEASEMDGVLSALATAMAKAAGFDWVMLSLYNDALDKVVERALNIARHAGTQAAATAREGRLRRDGSQGTQGTGEVASFHDIVRVGPLLIPDVVAMETNPHPAIQNYPDAVPMLRAFYERAHIVSVALFPILFQDKPLGQATFCSSTKRDLNDQEVELLSAVVSQAATAIKGLRLYRDLERSREELQRSADRLEEASRIEHHLARTDALTGLPNRRYIEEALVAECAQSSRYGGATSVVMADLDRFKTINDGYGHRTGDDALKFVSSMARDACRAGDLVGRWGGDEFLFILPSTDLDGAWKFAERFRTALAANSFAHPKADDGTTLTVSLGVAPYHGGAVSDLIEQADEALYRAKDAGRNCSVPARPKTHAA